MTAEPDLTWYEVVVEFALDHSDPACPSREDVFDAFVDSTPKGLVDASHSMGPLGDEGESLTAPAPTPDEDGVYRPVDFTEIRTPLANDGRAVMVALDAGHPSLPLARASRPSSPPPVTPGSPQTTKGARHEPARSPHREDRPVSPGMALRVGA